MGAGLCLVGCGMLATYPGGLRDEPDALDICLPQQGKDLTFQEPPTGPGLCVPACLLPPLQCFGVCRTWEKSAVGPRSPPPTLPNRSFWLLRSQEDLLPSPVASDEALSEVRESKAF